MATPTQIWREKRLAQLRATMPRDSADLQYAYEVVAQAHFTQPQDVQESCQGIQLRAGRKNSDADQLKQFSRSSVPVCLSMSDLPEQARYVLMNLASMIEALK